MQPNPLAQLEALDLARIHQYSRLIMTAAIRPWTREEAIAMDSLIERLHAGNRQPVSDAVGNLAKIFELRERLDGLHAAEQALANARNTIDNLAQGQHSREAEYLQRHTDLRDARTSAAREFGPLIDKAVNDRNAAEAQLATFRDDFKELRRREAEASQYLVHESDVRNEMQREVKK